MGQRGFANTGNVFNEQMAAREHAGEGEADLGVLAHDDGADLRGYQLNFVKHELSVAAICSSVYRMRPAAPSGVLPNGGRATPVTDERSVTGNRRCGPG